MSVEKIKQARQLLEIGELSQEDFDQIKASAMAEMGITTSPPKSDYVGHATNVDGMLSKPLPSFEGGMFEGTKVGAEGLEIGQYKVLELLGEGGMGAVYRGCHKNDVMAEAEGDVAIKLIKPQLAHDPHLRQRFIKEAALGKKIKHPNIANVISFYESQEHVAFIMAFIEGEELKDHIPPKGVPLEKALLYLKPIAEAVDYLHVKGVIHRDLKPANIKIRPDGTPVILDLGIAKEQNTQSGSMTQTGVAMGTEAYMAPEQLDAKNVDIQADQYALAMITYEMLTGSLPWEAGLSSARITVAKMTGGLRTLAEKTSISENVSAAVMKGLSLNPKNRYASCSAFVQALTECNTEESKGDVPSRSAINKEQEVSTADSLSVDVKSGVVSLKKSIASTNKEPLERAQSLEDGTVSTKSNHSLVQQNDVSSTAPLQPSEKKKSMGVIFLAAVIVLFITAFFAGDMFRNDISKDEGRSTLTGNNSNSPKGYSSSSTSPRSSLDEQVWQSYQGRILNRMEQTRIAGPLLQDICQVMVDGNTQAKAYLQKGYDSGYLKLCETVKGISHSKLSSPSFSCKKSDGRRETALCEIDELRELDGLMGLIFYAYRNRLSKGTSVRKAYVNDQKQWLSRSIKNCSSLYGDRFHKCIARETSLRIKYLINND